jgi:thioredoxin-related protein
MKNLIKIIMGISLFSSICAAPKKSVDRIAHLDTEEEVTNYLKKHKKSVIEFYNPQCPVCRAFKQKGIFPALAREMPEIGFADVNSKKEIALRKKYKIEATPTFVFFVNDNEIRRFEGYVEKVPFKNRINKIFSGQPAKAPAPTKEPTRARTNPLIQTEIR